MLKYKVKIYSYNGIHDLDIGPKGNISINPRLTISHIDAVKWYIFINTHITILVICMYNLVIENLNVMHPNIISKLV